MNPKRIVTISKFLSKHLRHAPGAIGLTLQEGGWVEVEDLLQACAKAGMRFSHAELDEVVASNDKQRFGFDASGERIRANQGHSVEVDLQLQPQTPPDVLFHGTAESVVALVLRDGLRPMKRQHVHLSSDIETARKVGARHGKPVVLSVDCAAMVQNRHLFWVSDNGVWLSAHVPAQFLRRT